jgi:hypothetical protein
MNRGQSRRNIFIEDKGRQTFLDLLAERGTDGSDLSWPAIGRSQACRDRQNRWTKTSSVSSAYLLMKERVAKEKQLQQRVRKIEEALTKSKKRT